jgi:membrane fusion protein, heavy metal efflux system
MRVLAIGAGKATSVVLLAAALATVLATGCARDERSGAPARGGGSRAASDGGTARDDDHAHGDGSRAARASAADPERGGDGAGRAKDGSHAGHDHDAAGGANGRSTKSAAGAPEAAAHASDEHVDDHSHAHGADEGDDGEVRVDPGMLRDLRVTTAPVETRPAGGAVEILGELHVNESAYAEIGAPIAARVAAVHATPGAIVKRGDVLVELTSPDLGRARATYQSAAARLELARQTLARQRELAAERIAPARRVQEATAEAVEAEAAQRAAAIELHALGADPADSPRDPSRAPTFVLRSPLDGTVIERNAVQGQLADPARPLVRVGDLRELWLVAHAFERDAVRIAPGAEARVKLTALPGRELTGKVTLVGSSVEPASRTIPIRIVLANEDGLLRPGMSATVRVPLSGGDASILSVPAAALQRLADGWVVFLPRGEGSFAVRPVGRGRDLGGEVEVVSGLRADERVVVDGAFLLKAEAEKARGGGGDGHHAH